MDGGAVKTPTSLTPAMRRALLAMLHRPGLPLGFFLRPVIVALENRGLAKRFETLVLTDEGLRQAKQLKQRAEAM